MGNEGDTEFRKQEENKGYELRAVVLSRISVAISNMSGVQPFQFEPTYPPGEEPVDSGEEGDEEDDELGNFDARVGNTEWCICGGNCVPMSTADECFLLSRIGSPQSKVRRVGG